MGESGQYIQQKRHCMQFSSIHIGRSERHAPVL
jgi:hypothetical protein